VVPVEPDPAEPSPAARAADRDAAGPVPPVVDPAELTLADIPVGRRLLEILIVLALLSMLVSALPPSDLREQARWIERPITDVTGLSQNWALFAPTPRSSFLRLRAEIERSDGTVEEWIPPVGDRVLGVMRTYRWRKWANGVVAVDATRLHRGAVHHLAHRFDDPDAAPITEIRLYRGVHRQPRPGSGEPADRDPVFAEELLHSSGPPAGVGGAPDEVLP
jgi:hypothetical protein